MSYGGIGGYNLDECQIIATANACSGVMRMRVGLILTGSHKVLWYLPLIRMVRKTS